jgi:hypothetical protein
MRLDITRHVYKMSKLSASPNTLFFTSVMDLVVLTDRDYGMKAVFLIFSGLAAFSPIIGVIGDIV